MVLSFNIDAIALEFAGAIGALEKAVNKIQLGRNDYIRLAGVQNNALQEASYANSIGNPEDGGNDEALSIGRSVHDDFDDSTQSYFESLQWSHQKLSKLFSHIDFSQRKGEIHWGGGQVSDVRFFHLRELLESERLQGEFKQLSVDLLLSGIYGGDFLQYRLKA